MTNRTIPMSPGTDRLTWARVPGSPLLGSLRALRQHPLEFLTRAGQTPPAGGPAGTRADLIRFRLGPIPAVLVNTADLVHLILVTHSYDGERMPMLRPMVREVFGRGLVALEGEDHRVHRARLQHQFTRRAVQPYADLMVAQAQIWRDRWQAGAVIDVGDEMLNLTRAVIAEVLLGMGSTDAAALRTFGPAMTQLLHALNVSFGRIIPLPSWVPTPTGWRYRRARRVVDATLRAAIAVRQRMPGRPSDLLGRVLAPDASGPAIPAQHALDDAVTFFFAGHETTATALTWCWYLLARNPEAATALRAQIRQAIGDRLPTAADLPALAPVTRIVQETLRLYPPSWSIMRYLVRPVPLPDGSGTLSPRTLVVISPYTLGRDPRYWDAPDQFRPDRFLQPPPQGAYLPFSWGPRGCIGGQFALMEMTLLITVLAARWDPQLLTATPQHPRPLVVLQPPVGGLPMRIAPAR